jgi:hypothetical protein
LEACKELGEATIVRLLGPSSAALTSRSLQDPAMSPLWHFSDALAPLNYVRYRGSFGRDLLTSSLIGFDPLAIMRHRIITRPPSQIMPR